MNPIAFTYDWGFVSDLARRNTARLCGALGVDHIIRTSNIEMKRKNVRLNVKAWLKRPEIGMIPLFMAGDKFFFYYRKEDDSFTKAREEKTSTRFDEFSIYTC